MFAFAKQVVTNHSDHPLLFSLLLLAVLFAAVGVAVEQFTGNGVAAAFLVIYAMLSALIGGLGYAILIAARLIFRARGRLDPTSATRG